MSTPVAYLRRSRVDTRRPGTLSHEQQLAAIRRIAEQHGDAELVILEDWGKSGREEKLKHRDGFAQLERLIADGEVSAVYAYDLSRLGRSLITAHRLAKACSERSIPIRCADGYSPDVSTAMGRMVLNILSSIAEYYADNVKERAIDTTMRRRARGDRIGKAPYGFRVVGGKLEPDPDEDAQRLVDAYKAAGSVTGAARLLNAAGVPTRRRRSGEREGDKDSLWRSSNLSGILEDAGVITRRPSRGRPARHTFTLSGLLRCSCGTTLTGGTMHGGRNVIYECKRARTVADHPRPLSVSETAVLPRVRELVDGLDWGNQVEVPATVVDRDELESRRRRILDNYEDGLISRDERNAKLGEVDRMISTGASPAAVESLRTAIDWSWPAPDVNRLLRLLIDHVELGPDLRPMGIVWRGRIAEWAS